MGNGKMNEKEFRYRLNMMDVERTVEVFERLSARLKAGKGHYGKALRKKCG
jgi:hypothetical protein